MNRLVSAAQQLVTQVTTVRPKSSWLAYGPPDGYQRIRSVKFDTATSGWLRPILLALQDTRIESFSDDEEMIVEFVGDVRADRRDSFPLVRVAEVLYEPAHVWLDHEKDEEPVPSD